jgi:3-phosphoshikimate 1-carboxyvinyltransferase
VTGRSETTGTGWTAGPVQSVGGVLSPPGDKSISHRALMLGAVAEAPLLVRGFLPSEDCIATRSALEQMGVDIRDEGDGSLRVIGRGPAGLRPPDRPLDLGNSGTAIRLMTGLLSGLSMDVELTGDRSLRSRPMERVARPLRLMGADLSTEDGRPPIRIAGSGRLRPIDYSLPVASAQVKSAVLLAGLFADGETVVRQPAVCRDHTERMLAGLGADISFDQAVVRLTGPSRLHGGEIRVPGDISSAAFFIVAGLLGADEGLLLEGVGVNPTRTGLIHILRAMGGQIDLLNPREEGGEPVADIRVRRSRLAGIDVPEKWVPLAIDEFPVLFVAAAAAQGVTRVRGAEELRVKESDRIAAMAEALTAVGVDARPVADGMDVTGGTIRGGRVDSHGDHRVAMAMAVAASVADDRIEIAETANVATSYPGFVDHARSIGLDVAGEGA